MSNLLPTEGGALPAKYEAARFALAECEQIDECKDWSDKAQALASYAKQSKDEELLKTAMRIKARAVHRCGELIKAIEKGKGNQHTRDKVLRGDAPPKQNRKAAAKAAGLSPDQAKDAVRVANIPEDEFEELIESYDPPTVTALAEIGKKKTHVSNNSKNDEWYTPRRFIDAARLTMGAIELDPASCKKANETVGAKKIYSAEEDGLAKKWVGNVWLNPPYSTELVPKFIDKLVSEREAGNLNQACVLVNNGTETKWFQKLSFSAAAICFPSGRIKFLDSTGTPAKSPLQGQAIFYIGDNPEGFLREFSQIGATWRANNGR